MRGDVVGKRRSRDPWAWIDEHLIEVDRPILGPIIGIGSLAIAIVCMLYAPAIIIQSFGAGVHGMATIETVECREVAGRRTDVNCISSGSFVAGNGSTHLTDITLHVKGDAGSRVPAQLSFNGFGEPYVSDSDPYQGLFFAAIVLGFSLVGLVWLFSAICRIIGLFMPAVGRG